MNTLKLVLGIIILNLLSLQFLSAQVPVLEWVGKADVRSIEITTDNLGNVYNTGSFSDTVDFDPGPEVHNLISTGINAYIRKLDSDGNLIWVKQISGSGIQRGYSIITDDSGNVYISGVFSETADFDPGPDIFNLTNQQQVVFVLKLDDDGNFIWAQQLGGQVGATVATIELDDAGNIYIAGSFLGTVDFDPGLGEASHTSNGIWDIFIYKMDSDGIFIWVKTMGGEWIDFGVDIEVDALGNLYTVGYFNETVDFDPGPDTFNLSTDSEDDNVFIQKLDANGNFIWVRQIGGNGDFISKALILDTFGNICITGFFAGSGDFDPGPEVAQLTSNGNRDIFIQKLDTNGNFIWAKSFGDGLDDYSEYMTTDDDGSLFISGSFDGTVDFNPGSDDGNLISIGNRDGFILKLDLDGNFSWAERIGGPFDDDGGAIVLDVFGNVINSGVFRSTVDFNPGAEINNLTAEGVKEYFLQKLSQCFPTQSPIPDLAELPEIVSMCEITSTEAPSPTAISECGRAISGTANLSFPITDSLVTEILWSYDDGYGNVFTQNQSINWTPIDLTAELSGSTITASNTNGIYQWLDCDNDYMPISGETSQSFTPTVNGNYAVEIFENGCSGISECFSIFTVDLNYLDVDSDIVVFPNPSSGIFNIEFDRKLENPILLISNSDGKVILKSNLHNTSRTSLTINESPGVYFLTLKSDKVSRTIPLIKQ